MRFLSYALMSLALAACAETKQPEVIQRSYISAETPTYAHLDHIKPLKVHHRLTSQDQLWMNEKQEQVFEEALDFEGRVFYRGQIALHLKPTPTMMRNNRYCRVIEESLRINTDEWLSSYLACKQPNGTWVQINEPRQP